MREAERPNDSIRELTRERPSARSLDDLRQEAERVPVVAIVDPWRVVRRMRQQMPDLHRRLARHRNAELRYGCLQIEAAVLHELQQHRGRVRFRQGGEVVDGVISGGYATLRVGHAEATGPHDAFIFGNRGRHAWNPEAGTKCFELPAEITEIVNLGSTEIAFSECQPPHENGQDERDKTTAHDDSRWHHGGVYEGPGPLVPIPLLAPA